MSCNKKRIFKNVLSMDYLPQASTFAHNGMIFIHNFVLAHPSRCGIRGGYMQMVGLDDLVMKELYKHVSVSLCPNTLGQVIYWTTVQYCIKSLPLPFNFLKLATIIYVGPLRANLCNKALESKATPLMSSRLAWLLLSGKLIGDSGY